MIKDELIKAVAEETGLNLKEAKKAVETTMNIIHDEVVKGGSVVIRNFGSVTRKARKARNIAKGTMIDIPATRRPVFKPCPEFKKHCSMVEPKHE